MKSAESIEGKKMVKTLTKWITAAVKETSSMTANPIKPGWQFHTSQRHLWPAHLRLQDAAVVEDEIGGDEFEARLFGLQRELHDPFIAWKRMERDSNEEKGGENAREMKLAWEGPFEFALMV